MRELTKSVVDRQNILNHDDVIQMLQHHIGLTGMLFEDEYLFTSKMVADFYSVDIRTIKRIIERNQKEIEHNGYQVLKGKKLKKFKDLFGHILSGNDDAEQKESNIVIEKHVVSRLKAVAVFNFRAFLNVGMLLTESEKARAVRSLILDMVIDTINQKTGGSTKYINQRDEEFLIAITREPTFRKEFTSALNQYLDMGNYKYSFYTDAIYSAIFFENAKEYKSILQLSEKENPRDTMYAEVLNLIASFEIGIAEEMKEHSERLSRKLLPHELDDIIKKFVTKRQWIPYIEDARTKMASRDYGLRDTVHQRMQHYIEALPKEDIHRYLGTESKELVQRVKDNPDLLDVFNRLKDR